MLSLAWWALYGTWAIPLTVAGVGGGAAGVVVAWLLDWYARVLSPIVNERLADWRMRPLGTYEGPRKGIVPGWQPAVGDVWLERREYRPPPFEQKGGLCLVHALALPPVGYEIDVRSLPPGHMVGWGDGKTCFTYYTPLTEKRFRRLGGHSKIKERV